MSALRKARVYVQNIYAGKLEEIDDGYSFVYDKDYLESENPLPVSLTMPLKKERYISNVLFPFFEGLIPEGWLLNIVTNNWKISKNDKFGILLLTCKDPIGDVRIEEM